MFEFDIKWKFLPVKLCAGNEIKLKKWQLTFHNWVYNHNKANAYICSHICQLFFMTSLVNFCWKYEKISTSFFVPHKNLYIFVFFFQVSSTIFTAVKDVYALRFLVKKYPIFENSLTLLGLTNNRDVWIWYQMRFLPVKLCPGDEIKWKTWQLKIHNVLYNPNKANTYICSHIYQLVFMKW